MRLKSSLQIVPCNITSRLLCVFSLLRIAIEEYITHEMSLFSLGKTRTKALFSINELPKILSVAQRNTRYAHRLNPSVLRAVCLIIHPVLVSLCFATLYSSSRPTQFPAAMVYTSYSLLVHRLTKPQSNSLISYVGLFGFVCGCSG